MTTSATTRLEAVNVMLSVLGQAPVNSLDGNSSTTVALAQLILDETLKECLTEGWHFNSEENVTFAPDTNNEIVVPDNVCRIDIEGTTADVTVRDGKLYDRRRHSFEFLTPVEADVIYLLDFEELPEVARSYVFVRAARKFQDRTVGTEAQHAFQARDELQARARLQDFEGDTGDYTVFDSPDVSRVVRRPRPRLF